jgi:hypothetical protein
VDRGRAVRWRRRRGRAPLRLASAAPRPTEGREHPSRFFIGAAAALNACAAAVPRRRRPGQGWGRFVRPSRRRRPEPARRGFFLFRTCIRRRTCRPIFITAPIGSAARVFPLAFRCRARQPRRSSCRHASQSTWGCLGQLNPCRPPPSSVQPPKPHRRASCVFPAHFYRRNPHPSVKRAAVPQPHSGRRPASWARGPGRCAGAAARSFTRSLEFRKHPPRRSRFPAWQPR